MRGRSNESQTGFKKPKQTALDRLREVAAKRGQKLIEYTPRQSEGPASPTTETESAKPAAGDQATWVRGKLPPWAKKPAESPHISKATEQNLAQRIVLIAGFLVILGMTLFPP